MILPTYTYAAIEFLAERDLGNVFEWGAGHSSVYYAVGRQAACMTVEHDRKWVDRLLKQFGNIGLPCHLIYCAAPLLAPNRPSLSTVQPERDFCYYANAITQAPIKQFNLIAVDGRARVECVKRAIPHLAPGGMLLLDNSERERYAEAVELLGQQDWQRWDFFGEGPNTRGEWQTSIWTRLD